MKTLTSTNLVNIVSQGARVVIIYGPKGSGKQDAAAQAAEFLVGERNFNQYVISVTPQAKSSFIKLEQIRELLNELVLSSFNLDQKRVVIINDAATLTPQSANALLKILEEPPKDVYFFLITPRLNALLPTIRSRAKLLRFNQPSTLEAPNQLAQDFLEKGLSAAYLIAERVAREKTSESFLHDLYSVATSIDLKKALFRAEKALHHNVNSRLIFEAVALEHYA